ncbi:hypothetical protein C8R45DRAFT_1112848 [Mycena sanguinolenta]|nr:hypothetical protein C8R45DRAFT_1112848 [Mycena sanguinolenta]
MTRLDLPAPLAPHSPPQLHPLRFSGAPGLPRRGEVSNAHPIHVQSHCAASHVLLLRDNYSSFRQASPAQARGRKHASGHDEESLAHTRTRDTNAPPTPPSTTMETQDDETQRGEQARGDALLRKRRQASNAFTACLCVLAAFIDLRPCESDKMAAKRRGIERRRRRGDGPALLEQHPPCHARILLPFHLFDYALGTLLGTTSTPTPTPILSLYGSAQDDSWRDDDVAAGPHTLSLHSHLRANATAHVETYFVGLRSVWIWDREGEGEREWEERSEGGDEALHGTRTDDLARTALTQLKDVTSHGAPPSSAF